MKEKPVSMYQQHYFKHNCTFIEMFLFIYHLVTRSFHSKTEKQSKKTRNKKPKKFLYNQVFAFSDYIRESELGNTTSKEKFKMLPKRIRKK